MEVAVVEAEELDGTDAGPGGVGVALQEVARRHLEPDEDPLVLEAGHGHRDTPCGGVTDRYLRHAVPEHPLAQCAQVRRHRRVPPEAGQAVGEGRQRQVEAGLGAQLSRRAAHDAVRIDEVAAVVGPAAGLAGVAAGAAAAVRAASGDVRLVEPAVAGHAVRERPGAGHQDSGVVQLLEERLDELGVPRVAARRGQPVEVGSGEFPTTGDALAVDVRDLLAGVSVEFPAHGDIALVVVEATGHQDALALGESEAAQHVGGEIGARHVAHVEFAVGRGRGRGDPGKGGGAHASSPLFGSCRGQ